MDQSNAVERGDNLHLVVNTHMASQIIPARDDGMADFTFSRPATGRGLGVQDNVKKTLEEGNRNLTCLCRVARHVS